MTEASGASNLLKPDVLKGTSPVLRGGGHGNVFPLTRLVCRQGATQVLQAFESITRRMGLKKE